MTFEKFKELFGLDYNHNNYEKLIKENKSIIGKIFK